MKNWLETQHSENKDHGFWSHHFMANRWGNNGNSDRLYFGGSKITEDVTIAMKLKKCLLLRRKVMSNLDSTLKKQGHYFGNKGPPSEGYGFSPSNIWM